MLWSKLFIPTLREAPAEAEAMSHKMLLRAGYFASSPRHLQPPVPVQRTLNKIIQIVREEMDAIGAQEMLLPALHPAGFGRNRGGGRDGAEPVPAQRPLRPQSVFGMTHEES